METPVAENIITERKKNVVITIIMNTTKNVVTTMEMLAAENIITERKKSVVITIIMNIMKDAAITTMSIMKAVVIITTIMQKKCLQAGVMKQ